MFGNDQPTPFDLRFRLAGIPVRVNPWFWIVMALLGSDLFRDPDFGPMYLLLWVACGFVSILVHEMGHAVAARLFGSPVSVSLIAFGGYARLDYPPRSPYKRILVSLAGPGAGFGLLGIVVGSHYAFDWGSHDKLTGALLAFLFNMNLFWNLLNLLPVWPLDGGQVCRELFAIGKWRNPDAAVHRTSMVVALILVALGVAALLGINIPVEGEYPKMVVRYLSRSLMLTIWMGLFANTNYQMLQLAQRRGFYYEDDDTPPWRRN